MFVDRNQELDLLADGYRKKGSVLVAIYGTRRIGKSTLINKFLEGKKHVYYLATTDNGREQLRHLALNIGSVIDDNILRNFGATDWLMLFSSICAHKSKEKLIIVIDEFPYLVRDNPALSSIFQAGWDQYLNESNVMLVLLGSSISMMRSEFLNYSAPLYGRTNIVMKIGPLPFEYTSRLLPKLEFIDKLYTYFIFGGVPTYYMQINSYKSLDKILEFIVRSGETFYSETSLLLSEEVRKDNRFIEILTLIAEGINKLSEVASKAHIQQSNLYYYIRVLEEIDMIAKEFPITEIPKERSKKVSYIIKNPFIKFWAIVMRRITRSIDQNKPDMAVKEMRRLVEIISQKRFEEFSKEFILSQTIKTIPFEIEKAGRWWGRDTSRKRGMNEEEIDVVALNNNTKNILFAECKWSSNKVGSSIYNNLKRKAKIVEWHNNDRKEYFALFSKVGFTEEMKKIAEQDNVLLFDLKTIKNIMK